MIWFLLVVGALVAPFLVFSFWYRFRNPSDYWKGKLIMHTNKSLPIFGDMWMTVFRRISFMDFTQNLYNMYPYDRYMGFMQLTTPTLVIRDPELIKQITVKDFDHFTDHRTFIDPEADPVVGSMLVFLKGQKWREMRATLSGAFTSSKMKTMFHLMEEAAENFVKFFLNKNEDVIEVEMKDTFTRYTNDVIATAAFGIQCDSLDKPNNDFYMMGKELTNFNKTTNIIRFLGFFVVPKLLKLFKISLFSSKITAFFKQIITETIKHREENGIVRPDMINLLLEAKKGIKHQEEHETIETGFATVTESAYNGKVKQIKNMTNELITSQALIFFLAGFHPISTAMCFGSYELVVNKEIQDRLRTEIKETYKENNGKITYEVLLQMKYLDMVISETLRMWPPGIALDRICTKAYTINVVNQKESSVHLKPGDVLLLPIYAIHRDPAYWPNPNKFNPERFSAENKDKIKPYTYNPFGSGPRNCIGSRFALLEMKALFFNLLLNFEIVPSKKTQIPIKISKKGQELFAEGGFWFALKRIKN